MHTSHSGVIQLAQERFMYVNAGAFFAVVTVVAIVDADCDSGESKFFRFILYSE